MIASRKPGTVATLQIVRDGRSLTVPVKLAERPVREPARPEAAEVQPPPRIQGAALGLWVRDLDAELADRLPAGTRGVVVSRVDPAGPAFDADIQRGHILLEINRRPVRSVSEYRRVLADAAPGDVLTLYVYRPGSEPPRALQTIQID
jgi:serine protease Do